MNENVNPDNVNPHFEHPERFGLYTQDSTIVEKSDQSRHDIETSVVRPCPSCGHCPTCGRGPAWPVYWRGPWYQYFPNEVVYCGTTSGGESATVHFGPIS